MAGKMQVYSWMQLTSPLPSLQPFLLTAELPTTIRSTLSDASNPTGTPYLATPALQDTQTNEQRRQN
jgi:hypothetical protein